MDIRRIVVPISGQPQRPSTVQNQENAETAMHVPDLPSRPQAPARIGSREIAEPCCPPHVIRSRTLRKRTMVCFLDRSMLTARHWYLVHGLALASPLLKYLPTMTSVFRRELKVERTTHEVVDVGALPNVDSLLEHEREMRQDMEEERRQRNMKGLRQTRAG